MSARKTQRTDLYRVALMAVAALCFAAAYASGDNDATPKAAIDPLPLAAAPGSAQPHLATGPSGQVVLSWQESSDEAARLRFSTLGSDGWSTPRTVASGDRWFVNWADFPSVVPISDDVWAAHWLVKRSGGTYAYDVALAVSADAGMSWSDAVTPHDDGTATEHGFVSLFPHDGAAGALWLDGRNMTEDSEHGHHGGGAMTLRSATIDRDAHVAGPALVDERVCDCCQTDVAIVGTTPVAVYRNRDDDEIRDIYVSRLEAAGWSAGAPVANDRWEIEGCPVNGPAIATQGQRVGIAWFTAAENRSRVRYAVSSDGGRSFGEASDLASGDTLGRVDVVLLEDGSAFVSHLRNLGNGAAEIVLRHVSIDGTPGTAFRVAETSSGRSSGFPQLVRFDDWLVFAWVDSVDGSLRVHSARIKIDDALSISAG